MTPDQYRNAISRLGLTQAQAAAFMGISIRTSHGYANGETIPRVVELLLKAMLRWDIKPSEL
jgi:transcriptional regulator with XRE-family HTH domain